MCCVRFTPSYIALCYSNPPVATSPSRSNVGSFGNVLGILGSCCLLGVLGLFLVSPLKAAHAAGALEGPKGVGSHDRQEVQEQERHDRETNTIGSPEKPGAPVVPPGGEWQTKEIEVSVGLLDTGNHNHDTHP